MSKLSSVVVLLILAGFDPSLFGGRRSAEAQITNVGLGRFSRERNCTKIKAVVDGTDAPAHQLLMLENCLYYYLQEKSSGGSRRISPSPLEVLPPTKRRERLPISVRRLILRRFKVNADFAQATIGAALNISWYDWRLQWRQDEWKISKLRIRSSSSIWTPDLLPSRLTAPSSGSAAFQKISVTPDGKVTVSVELSVQAKCNSDYGYPFDKHLCCASLYSPSMKSVIRYDTTDSRIDFGRRSLMTNWHVDSLRLLPRADSLGGITLDDDDENARLGVCLELTRNSGVLRVQLLLPAVMTALIVLVSPMAGRGRQQMNVKLYALLFQFLCFQFTTPLTPRQTDDDDGQPKIYRFYQFTFAVTVISLAVTLFTLVTSNKKWTKQPGTALNTGLKKMQFMTALCNGITRNNVETEGSQDIILAFNALMNMLISLVYLTGLFVILVL